MRTSVLLAPGVALAAAATALMPVPQSAAASSAGCASGVRIRPEWNRPLQIGARLRADALVTSHETVAGYVATLPRTAYAAATVTASVGRTAHPTRALALLPSAVATSGDFFSNGYPFNAVARAGGVVYAPTSSASGSPVVGSTTDGRFGAWNAHLAARLTLTHTTSTTRAGSSRATTTTSRAAVGVTVVAVNSRAVPARGVLALTGNWQPTDTGDLAAPARFVLTATRLVALGAGPLTTPAAGSTLLATRDGRAAQALTSAARATTARTDTVVRRASGRLTSSSTTTNLLRQRPPASSIRVAGFVSQTTTTSRPGLSLSLVADDGSRLRDVIGRGAVGVRDGDVVVGCGSPAAATYAPRSLIAWSPRSFFVVAIQEEDARNIRGGVTLREAAAYAAALGATDAVFLDGGGSTGLWTVLNHRTSRWDRPPYRPYERPLPNELAFVAR